MFFSGRVMLHEKQQISIWYFIGLLVLVYGVLIFGAGVGELFSPPENPRVLAELHVGVWWGALLMIIGGVYVYFFRSGRA
jgi:hypothetical protein